MLQTLSQKQIRSQCIGVTMNLPARQNSSRLCRHGVICTVFWDRLVPIPSVRLLQHRDRRVVHAMENISIPEVNVLKNSSTLSLSVPINLSLKLSFVSENGSRETYFLDALRITDSAEASSINFTTPSLKIRFT